MANPENARIPKVQKEPISAYAALGSVCFHLLFYYTAAGFAIAKMPCHPERLWDFGLVPSFTMDYNITSCHAGCPQSPLF
jgi:hypothetical protein